MNFNDKQTIFINSACMVNDWLYFSACNSNWLLE